MSDEQKPAPAAQLISVIPPAAKCDSCKKVLDPHNGNCRC